MIVYHHLPRNVGFPYVFLYFFPHKAFMEWPDVQDQMLSKMMGFSAFDSSKGRDHSWGHPDTAAKKLPARFFFGSGGG